MKTKLFAVVVAVMVVFAATAYAATDPDTFVFVTFGQLDTLDPAECYDTASGEIIHQIYDNLIAYEGSSLDVLIPMLATEVPSVENGLISEDGTIVKFPIREGVKFHNGEVLTPEDVEYTFERNLLADPMGGPQLMFYEPLFGVHSLAQLVAKLGGPDSFESVEDLDAEIVRKVYEAVDAAIEVDGNYVVFKLAAPYGPFLNILAKGGSWGSILCKSWMIENGAWDGQPDTWPKYYQNAKESLAAYDKENGCGPFKLVTWDKATGQIILERFDDYWREPAKLARVVIKYIDEDSTRQLMLKTGEADAVVVNAQFLDQVRGIPGVEIVENLPRIANSVLIFNFNFPVEGNEAIVGSGKLDGNGVPSDFFADVHVRRAFNCAFDYAAYIEDVAMGLGFKPYGAAHQVLPFIDKDIPWYDFDPDAAAEEFKKAFGGELWEKGFKLTLLYNSGNTQRMTAAQMLEYVIESINPKFQIDVQGMEWATYLDKLTTGSLPAFFMGWAMDFPDIHNFYVPFLHSKGTFAEPCMREFAKENFDALVEAGISATDPEERAAIYRELQQKVKDLAPCLFYYDAVDHRVHRDWVKGFVFNPAFSCNYDFYTVWKEVN